MVLEAWFFIAAALLVVSGGAKLWDPAPTRGALQASGLPSGAWTAPTLGIVEIAAGIAGTVLGGVASFGVAAIYLAFAGFVAYALVRKIPIQSCGCFGKADTPPSWLHLGFNVLSAAAASGVALSRRPPVDVLGDQPLWGIPYLGFVALGVWTVYLLLTELPRLREAAR
jgi:hypothetical protein